MNLASEHIHFVTGRLAEMALRQEVERLAKRLGFRFSIQVLPITVAALMTPEWISKRLEVPAETTQVLIPGYARGDISPIQARVSVPVRQGPKDLRNLDEYFGDEREPISLERYDIQIIAEINHAPDISLESLLAKTVELCQAGADVIDLGCNPGSTWHGIGDAVKLLKDHGIRVSVDSFEPREVHAATVAGAELVLSVNSSNVSQARDWGVEVVVVPDDPRQWQRMESTLEILESANIPFRIDPILEPIGFGFAASLLRYHAARQRWPKAPMMMGIGNLTELTDVDSAGVNFLLMALCQEWNVGSVLTTQVINWASSSVCECAWARRLVKAAIDGGIPPKRLSDQLVMLRDPRVSEFSLEVIGQLATAIKDGNYRILNADRKIHALGGGQHVEGSDPFEIFDRLAELAPKGFDPSHAFYLGYEMCKAELALQLGKQYTQDEPLRWGFLTPEMEQKHRISRRRQRESE